MKNGYAVNRLVSGQFPRVRSSFSGGCLSAIHSSPLPRADTHNKSNDFESQTTLATMSIAFVCGAVGAVGNWIV